MFQGVYLQLTKLGVCAVSWHAFTYPNKLHPKLTGWCRNKPLTPLINAWVWIRVHNAQHITLLDTHRVSARLFSVRCAFRGVLWILGVLERQPGGSASHQHRSRPGDRPLFSQVGVQSQRLATINKIVSAETEPKLTDGYELSLLLPQEELFTALPSQETASSCRRAQHKQITIQGCSRCGTQPAAPCLSRKLPLGWAVFGWNRHTLES